MMLVVGIEIAKDPLRITTRSEDLGEEAKGTQVIFLHHVTKSSIGGPLPCEITISKKKK